MDKDEIKKRLDKINNELKSIIAKMTTSHVVYSLPLSKGRLAGMKRNNPKGYKLLMRYRELNAEEAELEKKKLEG